MTSVLNALAALPRFKFACLPTPVQALRNLSAELHGPKLYVKRDDLTGLATGGNKTRKLEFLIADAVEQGADVVITAGGPQSNHCRQTAAAAAIAGLQCHLVLGGDRQPALGNLLLDELLGAKVHWTPKTQRNQTMAALAESLRGEGKRPYMIPVGGSNALGSMGYVAAMFELVEQIQRQNVAIDQIVFATSSGGTQTGIVLGAHLAGFRGDVTAISIDQLPDDGAENHFCADVCRVANDAAALLGTNVQFTVDDFDVNYDYLGDGYGVIGDNERNAIRRLARTEGLLVGPVYTGRAMGALIDLVEQGKFADDEAILFWHTGDEAALHAYADDLSD